MKKYSDFKLVENEICVSQPTLFCIQNEKNIFREKVYILKSDNYYNPCENFNTLFSSLKVIDKDVESVFIDLKNYYGKYTDSWLWKCNFIKNEYGNLYDIELEDVMISKKISSFEEEAIKTYLYKMSEESILEFA